MESGPKEKQPIDRGRAYMVLAVAMLVVCAGVIGYSAYSLLEGEDLKTYDTIEAGDFVYLDYIGRLPDGRVFDTSIYDVANDSARYPKSLRFSTRPQDQYVPLTMTAGQYGVEGSTIKGFALGVLGMRQGETKIVEVPPEDGYPLDPTKLVTIDLLQEIPATVTIDESEFRSLFPSDPIPMSTVPHYFWDWDVLVIDVSGGMVTYRHQPQVGQVVKPFGDPGDLLAPEGWLCVVEGYDVLADGGVGKVTVRHMVSPEDVYYVKGVHEDGNEFILWDYDESDMTFTIHLSDKETGYNSEVSGRTLFFEVRIISF
jgi:hypothetical protein